MVLIRNQNIGRLKVQVTTDPASPAVGVNVGAVDQTVTFANGQMSTAVTVPILSGAPNPGEVDVNLTISPVAGSRRSSPRGRWSCGSWRRIPRSLRKSSAHRANPTELC